MFPYLLQDIWIHQIHIWDCRGEVLSDHRPSESFYLSRSLLVFLFQCNWPLPESIVYKFSIVWLHIDRYTLLSKKLPSYLQGVPNVCSHILKIIKIKKLSYWSAVCPQDLSMSRPFVVKVYMVQNFCELLFPPKLRLLDNSQGKICTLMQKRVIFFLCDFYF